MTKRKTYAPEFKAKAVPGLVDGDDGLPAVAGRHGIGAGMPSGRLRQPASSAASVFATAR
jgi:transposase-like protein